MLAEGATIGRFVIVRQLGEGGMGTVYEARDPELSRSVAIKLMREPDRELALRLLREAQALAQLQHPNVVTVYELGLHADQVFIAMELVDGESLERYFARGRSSWRSVAALFVQAARGLAAAHAKGLVHRDIKPANLFVDDDGRVRVGDFGLARLADDRTDAEPDLAARELRASAVTVDGTGARSDAQDADASTRDLAAARGLLAVGMTRSGSLLGTPGYMAPEQLRGRRGTAASDQFSFCLAMWRALFGHHAFAGTGDELLASIAEGRRRETASGGAPRWLVRALDRGLAADPAARHPSMAALVRVLERGMSRRRAIVAGVIALFATLAAISAWRIVVEMRRADREAEVATARADEATLARASDLLATDPTAAVALLDRLADGAPQWRAARTVAADAAARGIAHVLQFPEARLLAFSPDGTRLASAGGGRVRVWDVATWSERAFAGPDEPLALAVTAAGALVTIDRAGAIETRDATTGAVTRVRELRGAPFDRAAIAPDGGHAVVFDTHTHGRLVDAAGGEVALADWDVAAWSPDGATLVLYDRSTQRLVRTDATAATLVPVASVQARVVATDGTRVWCGTTDGHVVELSSGRAIEWPSDHAGPITALAALADGTVASASSSLGSQWTDVADERAAPRAADYAITIADASPYRTVHLRGHDAEIHALATARELVASVDDGGAIRVWRRSPVARAQDGRVVFAATQAGGELVVAKRGPVLDAGARRIEAIDYPAGVAPPVSGDIQYVTRLGGRSLLEQFHGMTTAVTALVASADGRRIATLGDDARVVAWDLDAGRGALLAERATLVALSASGRHLATAHADKALRWWDASSRVMIPVGSLTATAVACDDTRIAVADLAGDVELIVPQREARVLVGVHDRLHVLAFSPDGSRLVGGGKLRTLQIWDVATGALRAYRGHTGSITLLAFSPDGEHVAAASGDGQIIVWRLADGQSQVLRGHSAQVRSITWRADGAALVSASDDHSARLWDLVSGAGRALPGADLYGAFAPDGRIVTVDRLDGLAWHVDDLPADEAGLRAWIRR